MSTPDPKLLALLTHVTREEAAIGQLETAIRLWFEERDPSSIHTLAVAVQGILTAVARDKKMDPPYMVKAMKTKPESFNRRLRRSQNFFKHGEYTGQKMKDLVPHIPEVTELILADNSGSFHRLFGYSTPFLDTFLLRYSLSFPESKIDMEATKAKIVQSVKIEDIKRLGRLAFAATVLPLIGESST